MITIVGYGYWGPKLVRNFLALSRGEPIGICDNDPARRELAQSEFPSVICFENFTTALAEPDCRAIVIATPVSTHYPLAERALRSGRHVLVEKPLAHTYETALALASLADEMGLCLMVDHTFLYHPAVQKINELITASEIGDIRYIDSTRINLGLFQNDVNVLWDLAVHDLSICQFFMKQQPTSVQAIGFSYTSNQMENAGYIILRYANGSFAHINSSWISPVKVRHTLIGGDKKMILYNDLDQNEPVKIYDTAFVARTAAEKSRMKYDYRIGDVTSPKIPPTEALRNLTQEFLSAIKGETKPLSSARFGAELVRILEAANVSLARNSTIVTL